MRFIKTHLISLLCGVVAIAALSIAIIGMTSDAVQKEMEKRKSEASKIRSLIGDPKNQAVINAEEARGKEFEREYLKTLEVAKEINKREPLMSGVFPKPELLATPVEFKEKYLAAIRRLPLDLSADTLPTLGDIQEEQQNVADLLALEQEQTEEGGGKAPAIQPGGSRRGSRTARRFEPGAPTLAGGGGGYGLAGGGGAPMLAGGGGGFRTGGNAGYRGQSGGSGVASAATSGEPKYDPVYRARVTKAKSIRCYFDRQTTFHISPIVNDVNPPANQMWFAQVGLWIQQDIVDAIAALNAEAAKKVTDADANVEHMPVKRLALIHVLGYQLEGKFIPFPSANVAAMREAGPSFTEKFADEQFDVVRFVVDVVVDQRELLRLIDRISKQNFYQCTNARYTRVSREEAAAGYMYGTAPVVRASLEFEGYMARDVYKTLMPRGILALLGIEGGDGG